MYEIRKVFMTFLMYKPKKVYIVCAMAMCYCVTAVITFGGQIGANSFQRRELDLKS